MDSSLQCLRHLGQTVNQGQGALRRRARPSSPFYLAVLSSDECAAPTLGAEPVLLNPNPDARPSPSRHSRSPRRPGRRQSHEPDRISDSECILQLAHIGRVRCGVEKPVSPLRAYSGPTRLGSVALSNQETDKNARYYVLVAACVLARKTEWLRNACLAAALIFPATAAIHAIVIAALHVDGKPVAHAGYPVTAALLAVSNTVLGAVDLDIYGAFQLCTIGILTAPATVRLSNTYFNNPGRNVLFIWTMLVLAGT